MKKWHERSGTEEEELEEDPAFGAAGTAPSLLPSLLGGGGFGTGRSAESSVPEPTAAAAAATTAGTSLAGSLAYTASATTTSFSFAGMPPLGGSTASLSAGTEQPLCKEGAASGGQATKATVAMGSSLAAGPSPLFDSADAAATGAPPFSPASSIAALLSAPPPATSFTLPKPADGAGSSAGAAVPFGFGAAAAAAPSSSAPPTSFSFGPGVPGGGAASAAAAESSSSYSGMKNNCLTHTTSLAPYRHLSCMLFCVYLGWP